MLVDEARYDCPYCGEEIIIPVDISEGEFQEYVEECPVCCYPVVLQLQWLSGERVKCSATCDV